MTENIATTSQTQKAVSLGIAQKTPTDAECRNDLQCRIDALQKIVTQLLAENERLRGLVLQIS